MVNALGPTVAGVMGNVLEWYDFALFGFFSDIIAKVFFPPSAEAATSSTGEYYDDNLLMSFAVYGGAFLMRPVGGVIIGYMGDKYGRKHALVLSLTLMAVPTCAMGCLPTYEQVGVLSTILLVCCRLLQGMSVGGQLPASLVYTVETRPKERWGLYGALVMMAANIGTLMGNVVGASLRSVLTEEQLVSWGWRIPFLSGILIAFVAIYLKTHGEEHNPNAGEYGTEDRREGQEEVQEPVRPKNPLREAIRKENLPALISATLTPMLWGAGFYVTFVWMAIFMDDLIQPPVEHAFWINAFALFFGVTLPLPLTGLLSDYCGRAKVMVAGALGLGALGPVMVLVISKGQAASAFFAQLTLGLLLSLYGGPICAWLVEKFPPKVRLTSVSLGYDLAHSSASAFSPLVATLLARNVSLAAPGFIYSFFAILGLIGIFITTRIHKDEGVDDDQARTLGASAVRESGEETDPQISPIV